MRYLNSNKEVINSQEIKIQTHSKVAFTFMDNLTDESPTVTDGKVTLQELYNRCSEQEKVILKAEKTQRELNSKINERIRKFQALTVQTVEMEKSLKEKDQERKVLSIENARLVDQVTEEKQQHDKLLVDLEQKKVMLDETRSVSSNLEQKIQTLEKNHQSAVAVIEEKDEEIKLLWERAGLSEQCVDEVNKKFVMVSANLRSLEEKNRLLETELLQTKTMGKSDSTGKGKHSSVLRTPFHQRATTFSPVNKTTDKH